MTGDVRGEAQPELAVGLTFSEEVEFTADTIAAFARLVGDSNALHHDAAAAAQSRFGGLIASGSHTGSVMMGCAAAFFSRYWPNVGLGYSVRLRRAVRAGDHVRIEWRVVGLGYSAKLRGTVATLEGRLVRDDGEVAVTAGCEALIEAEQGGV